MNLKSCVTPSGQFVYGIHKPFFKVENFRENDLITTLGSLSDGTFCDNKINFPKDAVEEKNADWIYEIPNVFPFRGTTFIAKSWADAKAADPLQICLPKPEPVSFSNVLKKWFRNSKKNKVCFQDLPESVLFSLATTSTDPNDLVLLAELCCEFEYKNRAKVPTGLIYKKDDKGRTRAIIKNHDLFEALVNNIYLPDVYKEVMVLRPGVQGGSEIVGEMQDENTHIFEYLRRNSYIPWGHYAANMANDSIRYDLENLSLKDMKGLRHLYYQRIFSRLANLLGLGISEKKKTLSIEKLEMMRMEILGKVLNNHTDRLLDFNGTLWGWNYGFDFAPSKYRLHASHQMIHQQFALLPSKVTAYYSDHKKDNDSEFMDTYGCGDQIYTFIKEYHNKTGHHFFDDYIKAIRTNKRMDDKKDKEKSLVVYEDEHVMAYVPKGQTSQWELQLMTLTPVGNILEADIHVRKSIDQAMFYTMKIFSGLGAKMVTTIEYPKRFDAFYKHQHLIYSFLPKLPYSPGAFSEAQLRWINRHYPEDFATTCRDKLNLIKE